MAALHSHSHSHSHSHGDDADCHAAGALAAALVNFPLWRAGALLLYGAQVEGRSQAARLFHAALRPPYRATFASIFAMTWSRGAVFYGSDRGKCLGDAPAHLLQQFILVCLCACVSFLSLSHQTITLLLFGGVVYRLQFPPRAGLRLCCFFFDTIIRVQFCCTLAQYTSNYGNSGPAGMDAYEILRD
jgi:hypothetical protein